MGRLTWPLLVASAAWALPQQPGASTLPTAPAETEEAPPGDEAARLLDAILSSPNTEAADALYRATFAAGQTIIPELKAALKDDRTAEFAAQSLAFIGGDEALTILSGLVKDARDLNLRRFYYSALAEVDTPQSNQVLLEVIRRSDTEPDRTVSQAAVLALTVRSSESAGLSPGLGLVRELRAIETRLKDIVIRDDLDSAIAVIEGRTRYLASAEGMRPATSVESAIRAYFAPALAPPSPGTPSSQPAGPPVAAPSGTAGIVGARSGGTDQPLGSGRSAKPTKPVEPIRPIKVETRQVVLSPEKSRALARVTFEDTEAMAQYDMVLAKRDGTWRVVSVWLGSEAEKPDPEEVTRGYQRPATTRNPHPTPGKKQPSRPAPPP